MKKLLFTYFSENNYIQVDIIDGIAKNEEQQVAKQLIQLLTL